MDADIETMARSCSECQVVANEPRQAPLHPWEFPTGPWQRLHVDFAGPFLNRMWLIAVDAYSKWPVVKPMGQTTATATIEALRLTFAAHGLPMQIVSDNGPQFTSGEYGDFCKGNGIQRILVSPYHPRSNGEAERFVQTFKKGMVKCTNQQGWKKSLAQFLLRYRATPHPTTGVSPSELLCGRVLRTRLDLLRPDVRRTAVKSQENAKRQAGDQPLRLFKVGDTVWARTTVGLRSGSLRLWRKSSVPLHTRSGLLT